jgi:hypothetical protein
MYEEFGGIVDQKAQTVTFKLFIPDGSALLINTKAADYPDFRA